MIKVRKGKVYLDSAVTILSSLLTDGKNDHADV
jgi:hypothetical protein